LFGEEEQGVQEPTTVSLTFARGGSKDLELKFYSSVDAGGFGELGDGGLDEYTNLWSKRGDRGASGLTIWAASVIFGRWALAQPAATFEGKRGLELGSGLGVAGIVVSSLCREIVLSDNVTDVLAKLQANVELNQREATCTVERVDWSEGAAGQKYDFILAADVMYEAEAMPSLAGFVAESLAPGGFFVAISADTRAGLSAFQAEMAAAKGGERLRVETQCVPPEHLMAWEGGGDTFVILTVQAR